MEQKRGREATQRNAMQHSEERGLDSNDLLEVKNEGYSLRYPVEEKRNDRSQENSNAHTPLGVSEDEHGRPRYDRQARSRSFISRSQEQVGKDVRWRAWPAVLSIKNRRVDKAGPMA